MELDRMVVAALEAPSAQLRAVLQSLVDEVGTERARELLAGVAAGTPRKPSLADVADVVAAAQDLEELTRPLLDALQGLTGLASTYLTFVDEVADEQEIRYSRNATDGFAIPEGLRVPWADTLCQRALREGRPCSTDVAVVWADSAPAKALGIQTYVSVPVRLADGRLWGTLCGADPGVVHDAERHLPTLGLFARLIAAEVERAAALTQAKRAAELDPLTGCASRRGIDLWLTAAASVREGFVAAVFLDLDDFKAINDVHGHAMGDAVLRETARLLRSTSREQDLVGRLGGDEFVVAAVLAAEQVPTFLARWRDSLQITVEGLVVHGSVGTALLPPDRVGELLVEADRAMYAVKRGRRTGAIQVPEPGAPADDVLGPAGVGRAPS